MNKIDEQTLRQYASCFALDEDEDELIAKCVSFPTSQQPDKENLITRRILGEKCINQTQNTQTNKHSQQTKLYKSHSAISQSSLPASQLGNNSGSLFNCLITQSSDSLDENSQIKRRKFLESEIKNTFPEDNKPRQSNPISKQGRNNKFDLSLSSEENFGLDFIDLSDSSFYGLPKKVKELYKSLRGIESLYDWQHELLTTMQERDCSSTVERNLLYLSPTSGGKTLVAEIMMLQCLVLRKKSCIFIMPYVSIVQEKIELMQPFGESLNFYVDEYAGVKGTVPPVKRRKPTMFICTMEKAHSLINSLIETERLLSEVGLVVGDELHMIGDGSRGAIYEMILSKIKYYSAKNNSHIQLVATTATLENKKEMAKFLDAYLYERDFRPVELKEFIKLDKQIFEVDKAKLKYANDDEDYGFVEFRREVFLSSYSNEMKTADPDGLIALIREVYDIEGPKESCLIFCSTKKNCENVATLLATHLPAEFKKINRDLKLKLFNELKEQNGNNVCAVLRQSIQYGIAYHHSGLTTEERQLIEQAYRDGVLFLLTCTSTLAAGVNLPAKRVIIRSPYVGRDFISPHQYRQMIGRAGRAGLNSSGESILIFQLVDKTKVYDLISGPMKRCESSFQYDDFKAIRLLILSLIGLNITHFGFDILDFFQQTLFFMQNKEKIKNSPKKKESSVENGIASAKVAIKVPDEFSLISNGLVYLLKKKFVKVKSESESSEADAKVVEDCDSLFTACYEVTKLGLAAIKGNIDLDFTHQLYADLNLGLRTMVLSNYLHLLFLCTPYDLVNNLASVDYDTYARKYCNLNEDEIKCACIIGVPEECIQKRRFNTKAKKEVDENVIKRFYMSLIIYELWKNNKSIWKVSSEFNLDRGFVQQIIQSAASFTSGVLHFCENLDEFWPYKNLLQELMKRLQYNCTAGELIPLMEIENVRLPRAQQLYNAGFRTIEIVAASKALDMSAKIKNMPEFVAKKLIKSAKRIMQEKIETLQSEAENLLQQINPELLDII